MSNTTVRSKSDSIVKFVEIFDPKDKRITETSDSKNFSSHKLFNRRASQASKPSILKTKRRSKAELDNCRQELNINDHLLTLEELQIKFCVDISSGLMTAKAEELLKIHGRNALIPEKQKSRLLIFCEFMFGGFSMLLWLGALLTLTGFLLKYFKQGTTDMQEVYLAIVLVLVVIVTGIFGFYQETNNQSIMESFKKMIPKTAEVIRDGVSGTIDSEELVVGDVVIIYAGLCVPADLRLIECNALKVDNSSITGESEPQQRALVKIETNPLEAANLAFYGTNVIEGSGIGIVIATGDTTLMGKIAGLTSGLQPAQTPIKKELKQFIHLITGLSLSVGLVFFGIAMYREYSFFDAFIFFIAIVVANVPEGLLVTMTASLTLTARRMAKKNCMVKHLHAIETLGSTNVICSDKTGTLTQNVMTVSHLYYDSSIIDVLSDNYDARLKSSSFDILCRVGILCNKAVFEDNDDVPLRDRKVKGDASETAVLKCMERLIGNTINTRKECRKVLEIPFNSTNKYQLSIHIQPGSANYLLVMKGAPERILEACTVYYSNSTESPLDEAVRKKIKMALLELGYMGERVLGFADMTLPGNKYPANYEFNVEKPNFSMDKLRFVGLMSMIDPPRAGVPVAVEKCKSAGIRVIMVTGDHPVTAMAIAKKVGIISRDNDTLYDMAMRRNISVSAVDKSDAARCEAIVVTGSDIREMEDYDLDSLILKYKEIVFARTSPQQKLQIVEAFQRQSLVVAVTGDGVNDSPALKKADIGIAMGITGSEVSKEAADMIILDDNFASIVTGIEEGRLIFDNLKKSIAYMLTSNVPELIPFLLHVTIGIPNPLSVMAILIIDIGTDLWPGISLAYEKAEADIMKRTPRNPKSDRLVNNRLICFTYLNIGVIQSCAGLSSYFLLMAGYGFYPAKLLYIRHEWELEWINDVKDSFGQEWTFAQRQILEHKGISAYFLAIVITQIADCFICKTRRLSILHQGMTNAVMNWGILFEISVAIIVVYCPKVNEILQFNPVPPFCLWPAVAFGLVIIIYDETRRFLLRRTPGGWCDRETYF